MKTTADYLAMLETSYAYMQRESFFPNRTRLEYLSEEIFDFTTYATMPAEHLAVRALEVVEAITDRTTFVYIRRSDAHHVWYIVMCNLPFFKERINWGTSIRGAWWDHYKELEYTSCGLFDNDGNQIYASEPMTFEEGEWEQFMRATLAFAAVQTEATDTPTEEPTP